MTEILTEGWVAIFNSTRYHYVRNEKSLCGKWLYLGREFSSDGGDVGDKPGPDDCKKCWAERAEELTP